jgi:hypothetical protein
MGLKYALELRDQLIEKSQKLNLAGSIGLLQGLRKHGINGIILTHSLTHSLTHLLTHSLGNVQQQIRDKKYIELRQKQQQVMRLLTDINTEARILSEEADVVSIHSLTHLLTYFTPSFTHSLSHPHTGSTR